MTISIKQKKTYIERITNNDILTRELKINILKIVVSSNKLSAIRYKSTIFRTIPNKTGSISFPIK